MNIQNKTILITGANRGIGKALLDEELKPGVKKGYAGTRSGLEHPDKRLSIFPDPDSQSTAEGWRTGAAKELERQFATFMQQSAAAQ